MNITIIHGQTHHGVTYTMTEAVLKQLKAADDEVREFFLPQDGPGFCVGCNACFLKGETHCPDADTVQPIALALEWADVIILDSPNYVMEMSGAMKNLMDHLAYRWVTHRPHGSMFCKVGITVSSSAGAPPNHVINAMAKQLKWLCVSKVYGFPLISNAMDIHELKPKKRAVGSIIRIRACVPESRLACFGGCRPGRSRRGIRPTATGGSARAGLRTLNRGSNDNRRENSSPEPLGMLNLSWSRSFWLGQPLMHQMPLVFKTERKPSLK